MTVSYKYFEVKHWVIVTHNPKVWCSYIKCLQAIRQNLWTMKYRSQWSTFILRSYWLIIPKYDVHTSNSLQDIRQNHWTVKYRSCWPSLHDPQVHVTRLSHVWPIICTSCFHNRKVEKHFLRCLDFDLYSHPGAWTLGSGVTDWKPTLQGTYGPNMNAFWWVVGQIYPTWETRNHERTNERTNKHTYERKDENYIPLGINARGIMMLHMLKFRYEKYPISW